MQAKPMMALLAGLALATPAAFASEAIATKAGCLACHKIDVKLVGPAYKDVAAKYKGQDVAAKLADKVRKGGSGVWGPIPMPPNPPEKINDADLKAVVQWVLNR
ncbi:MAG: c-type cytochrome [Rhodocyclaceae bacterium]|nr:c-type cytochrome [Rhodocyclaceae bacterium]